jgi:hypothetical protein
LYLFPQIQKMCRPYGAQTFEEENYWGMRTQGLRPALGCFAPTGLVRDGAAIIDFIWRDNSQTEPTTLQMQNL